MIDMIGKKRFVIKFVLPVLLILCVLCVISAVYLNMQSNRFYLTVYEGDKMAWTKINKDMKIMPLGVLGIFANNGNTNISNTFRIEGNNIKSVSFESPDSSFVDYEAVRRAPDKEAKLALVSHPPGSVLTIEEYIYEAMIQWDPNKLIGAKFYGDYGGDYTIYMTDIFTVTVVFDDGQKITQIIKVTVDENTGRTSVQRISAK